MNKINMAKFYQKLSPRKLTRLEAKKEIEEMLAMIEKGLKENRKIKFTNVGVIEVVNLQPRRIANPNTKEPMIIHPPKDVRFRESTTARKKENVKEEI